MADAVEDDVEEKLAKMLANLRDSETGDKEAKRDAILPAADYMIAKHEKEKVRLETREQRAREQRGPPLDEDEEDLLDDYKGEIAMRRRIAEGTLSPTLTNAVIRKLVDQLSDELSALRRPQQRGGRRRKTRRRSTKRSKKSRKSRR